MWICYICPHIHAISFTTLWISAYCVLITVDCFGLVPTDSGRYMCAYTLIYMNTLIHIMHT